MKLTEILKRNRELGQSLVGERYPIAIISNITVNPLKEVLEFTLRDAGLNAEVAIGDYDAILQDSARFGACKAVLVLWEAGNLTDGLHHKADVLPSAQLEALAAQTEGAIKLVLDNLKVVPLVLVNRFSAILFNAHPLQEGALNGLCKRLNHALETKVSRNQVLVDLDAVLAEVGVGRAIDLRQYQSSKALYSVDFYKAYAEAIKPAFIAASGRARKVLVLDCDNTLWGGILGEDGVGGIKLDETTPQGKAYQEAQNAVRCLRHAGVLIALCSKNNWSDVQAVLRDHPAMLLRETDLVAHRVNWQDKATNIRELATELNLGLDSFVFVDDSAFELGLVQEALPQVKCVRVPANLSEYPAQLRKLSREFYSLGRTAEDVRKTEMYQQEKLRKEQAKGFGSTQEYLAALGLELTILWGADVPVARAAQMTQKTNQFNLTTRRYTEADIQRMKEDPGCLMAVFSVTDRYGDYGISGMTIIRLVPESPSEAVVDTFLMSCRVIGRNVEQVFFDEVVQALRAKNLVTLRGEFRATAKNDQVRKFYPSLGFEVVNETPERGEYRLSLATYRPSGIDYIESAPAQPFPL